MGIEHQHNQIRMTAMDKYKRDVKILELIEKGKTIPSTAMICACSVDIVKKVIKRGYAVMPKPPKEKKVSPRNKPPKLNGQTMLKALVQEDFNCLVSRGSRARAYAPMYLQNKYVPAIAIDIAKDYR